MILLFGANGQLGQELVRTAAQRGTSIAALTKSDVDIADQGAVARAFEQHRPKIAVNAAAYTKVDAAEDNWEAAVRANCEGAAVIAAACAKHTVPLVHISTDYVFDGRKQTAYVETDAVAPIGAYGRSKAMGEDAIRAAQPWHLIMRTSWVYSEFGSNFVKTVLRLARERDELRIVSDQRGCPTSTRDLADAILKAAPQLCDAKGLAGTYHYAGAGDTTWYGFATQVVNAQTPATGRTPKVIPIATKDYPTRAMRPMNSTLDSTRFSNAFGIRPKPWQSECNAVVETLTRAA